MIGFCAACDIVVAFFLQSGSTLHGRPPCVPGRSSTRNPSHKAEDPESVDPWFRRRFDALILERAVRSTFSGQQFVPCQTVPHEYLN